MAFENNNDVFGNNKTLLIDGDIIVYRPCCTFNEDDNDSRQKIANNIRNKVTELMVDAGCSEYRFFVTTKQNYRDHLVDDYKANRVDKDRPVNLAWAKRWAVDNLDAEFVPFLEADDLLGIHQTEDTVIWSLDKDLRQIPGNHLDEASRYVIRVDEEGALVKLGSKIKFNGGKGFLFQLLIGDSTDYILGCGVRVPADTKMGEKRKGIGASKAYNMLIGKSYSEGLEVVKMAYKDIHGDNWQQALETQANLLFMIREQQGELVKLWTFDNRREILNIKTGLILDDNEADSQWRDC